MNLHTVGLNLLYLVPGETGGSETVARAVVPRLPAAAPEIEFVAFVNDEAAPVAREIVGPDVAISHIGVSGRSRPRRVLAEQIALPRAARRHNVDLLHSFASTGPGRSGVVDVVTVLDVIYAIEPEAHTLAMRLGMNVLVPLAARRAERIITLSNSAAEEIVEVLGVPRDKIDAIYLGGRAPIEPTPEQQVREQFELGDAPLVLSVSARRPHKNLPRLLQAFASIDRDPAPVLVLPGYATSHEDELAVMARELGVDQRVRFLGWVEDPDLEALYRLAACFVFPSLAEGFGLPVLEAMERGVPVACSDVSSLPEVGGNAVRYFDPHDASDIARSIMELLDNRALAEQLIAAGREQAALFSWERTARETVASYRRAWTSARESSP